MSSGHPAIASRRTPVADKPIEFQRLDALRELGAGQSAELQKAVQEDARRGLARPSDETKRLAEVALARHEAYKAELKRVQEHFGLTEELLEKVERASRKKLLGEREWRWRQREIDGVGPTETFDEGARRTVERLLASVDADWLADEGKKPYRLGDEFLRSPLHIINGGRVSKQSSRPQRFARMLLVARDHLDRRDDLDFFEARWVVPELAALGAALDLIPALGPEAVRKCEALPSLDEVATASTIYELLVGCALVRRGHDAYMLPEDKREKTPDFEIRGLGVPMAVECKRKL